MKRILLILGVFVGTLALPTLSALAVGGLLHVTGLAASRSPLFWIAATPTLYILWLLILALLYALHVRLMAGKLEKPRRLAARDGRRDAVQLILLGQMYRRAALLGSLPFLGIFAQTPLLRDLMFLTYAKRVQIGKHVVLYGKILDPDLTRIGDRAVIGANSSLVAHTLTLEADGTMVYHSAPIVIGSAAVIGGESFVGMGVKIGQNALVELGSLVSPFTVIPAGEVWGGNPAVFRRMRVESEEDDVSSVGRRSTAAVPPGAVTEELQELVADALELPRDRVHAGLNRANCARWDSLGQMAIAAAVFDRFGVELEQQQIFSIRSLDDLAQALGGQPSKDEAVSVTPVDDPLTEDPELLPLGDHEVVTRELARRDPEPARVEITACIAASFTAQPLANAARLWSRAFGIDLRMDFCGFDQVAQALTAADSPFRENERGLNVVLVRPEDLPGATSSDREAAAQLLLEAVGAFAASRDEHSALIVGSLPPAVSSHFRGTRGELDQLRSLWSRRLSAIAGVELLEFAALLEAIGTRDASSAGLDVIARAPYSPRAYQELGIELARLARRRSGLFPPAKVIALDCDGTLWGGVLGEDGPEGIQVGDDGVGRAFRLFQQYLLELKERGILLALVSRNEEDDVRQVLDRHPGMALSREDIAAARIEWADKSESLRGIAAELNVGLDSIVFVDDDPAVRLEVAARVPEVTVVPLPTQPERYIDALSRLWIFDAAPATAEDRSRTQMIQTERERRTVRKTAPRLEDYLRQLELRVAFRLAEERDLPRVAQLTQKTNQFNLSLRRRTLDEIRTLGEGVEIYVVSATDRFGDYGTVGVAIVAPGPPQSEAVELETWLLSCRALGRGIEQAFLTRICEVARTRGARRLEAPLVHGPRNQPLRVFVEQSGFVAAGDDLLQLSLDEIPPAPTHIRWEPTDSREAAYHDG